MKENRSNFRKFIIFTSALIYIIGGGVLTLRTFEVSNNPEKLSFSDLPLETQKGISQEASRNLLSVDEFVDTYVFSTRGTDVEINKLLFILLILLLLFPLYLYVITKIANRTPRKDLAEKKSYDELRISQIQKIQSHLGEFYKQHTRYPSGDEYKELINSIEENINDPKDGKVINSLSTERFGYYYDQFNPKTQKNEQTYFHLWCYLENGSKYELTPSQI